MKQISFDILTVQDNESAAAEAIDRGDFIKAFLLIHSLFEALLRVFVNDHRPELSFAALIKAYEKHLSEEKYPTPEFVSELTQFNRRRNRIIHELWAKGYTLTNRQAEPAARGAVLVYGLFIDWLSTFDESIAEQGFKIS